MTMNDAPSFLPRSLRTRLVGWRRDLHMLREGLAGRHPPPVTLRQRRQASSASAELGRTLRVARVVRETPDAVTLILADPSGAPFQFEAGQFLTLLLPLAPGGELLRRAYSASSSPLDGQTIAITSKRVAQGKVSNYLNDAAQPGMLIKVLGPSGNFTPLPRSDKRRHVVLIGGGSGITPLMSIAETVLRVEPSSRVSMIYGNRGLADIIFFRRLDALCQQHAPRLHLRHVLSQPPPDFTGGVGMLDEAVLSRELSALPEATEAREFYLCGPEPMMAAARSLLLKNGVAAANIFEERFATLRYSDEVKPTAPQPMELVQRGAPAKKLTVAAGETLLEAGLRVGMTMPFSCAMGGCGACKGRLIEGQVSMPEPNCLTTAERQAGYVLCCVARPHSPVRVELPSADRA
jgi:ring-1,2-phenylacetyl-CoA epoxidase subunit PaaE